MRVLDLPENQIIVGMRIRSLKDPNRLGTVVEIDHADDDYAWVLWDGDKIPTSGFWGNDCRCEVVEFGLSESSEQK